jgi:hypothetical protein
MERAGKKKAKAGHPKTVVADPVAGPAK